MLSEWKQQWQAILAEFQQQVPLSSEHILVIGCSTSEVIGKKSAPRVLQKSRK